MHCALLQPQGPAAAGTCSPQPLQAPGVVFAGVQKLWLLTSPGHVSKPPSEQGHMATGCLQNPLATVLVAHPCPRQGRMWPASTHLQSQHPAHRAPAAAFALTLLLSMQAGTGSTPGAQHITPAPSGAASAAAPASQQGAKQGNQKPGAPERTTVRVVVDIGKSELELLRTTGTATEDLALLARFAIGSLWVAFRCSSAVSIRQVWYIGLGLLHRACAAAGDLGAARPLRLVASCGWITGGHQP